MRICTKLPLVATLVLIASIAIPQGVLAQNGEGNGRNLKQIDHIIVIYQENWSFDSLYGLFPGANGLFQSSAVSLTQRDRLTGQPYRSQLGGVWFRFTDNAAATD